MPNENDDRPAARRPDAHVPDEDATADTGRVPDITPADSTSPSSDSGDVMGTDHGPGNGNQPGSTDDSTVPPAGGEGDGSDTPGGQPDESGPTVPGTGSDGGPAGTGSGPGGGAGNPNGGPGTPSGDAGDSGGAHGSGGNAGNPNAVSGPGGPSMPPNSGGGLGEGAGDPNSVASGPGGVNDGNSVASGPGGANDANNAPSGPERAGDSNGITSGPGHSGDANGVAGEPGNGNTSPLPPAPQVPLSPREACRKAWLEGGHHAQYGDPFLMAAAQHEDWTVTFRVADLDIEARPSQYLEVNTAAVGGDGNCRVPTGWYVEILTPAVGVDPFLQTYQRMEPIRRQLATGGIAMEEKSFSSWQDFSDRTYWLTWNLRPFAPTNDQLVAAVQALGPPALQEARWYNAVDAAEDTQTPGLAVAIGVDADPTHAQVWGVLSDPVRATAVRRASKNFFAVAPPSISNSFYRAIAMANAWSWDRLVTWEVATQQAMACDFDAETFERRCDQVFPAYAARLYRESVEQNQPMYVHFVWETRAKVEAFVTTAVVQPGGSVVVETTRRFADVPGLQLPPPAALHALDNP